VSHLGFGILHIDKTFIKESLPIIESACCAIASDRYILADDFALFPLVVIREYFRNTNSCRAFIVSFGNVGV